MNEKQKKYFTILIWFLATAMLRVLYYVFDNAGVLDSYGFFDANLILAEENDHILSSGLGFAYINSIHNFCEHFGYDINHIYSYQFFLEMLALLMFFIAAAYFWRFKTALIICSVLSVSPVLLEMLGICSPEEYFLFYFSIIFLVLSIFSKYTRNHRWTRSTLNEIIVLIMGIYSGVIITWNYMGLLSVVIMIIIVIRNYRLLNDKKRIQNMVDGYELEEGLQVMSVFSQLLILSFGIFLGMFFTLLKYTGYTGEYLVDQFHWYFGLYKSLPGKTMDLDTTIAILLLVFILLGILIEKLYRIKDEKIENERLADGLSESAWSIETEQAFVDRGLRKAGESTDYFITEDGRKVFYLENPLPLPKKGNEKTPLDSRFDLNELVKDNRKVIIFDAEIDKEEKKLDSMLDISKIDESVKQRVKFKQPVQNPMLFRMNKLDFDYEVDSDDDFDV